MCRKFAVTGLVGTGWKEEDKLFNQVRIIDTKGALVGAFMPKSVYLNGDAKKVCPGKTPARVLRGRLDRGSLLICNDLLGDPRFHRRPNPHLTLQQATALVELRADASAQSPSFPDGRPDARYRVSEQSGCIVRAGR